MEVFAYPPPEHGRGYVVTAALLLRFVQYMKHDALPARQTIANVGDVVMAHAANGTP